MKIYGIGTCDSCRLARKRYPDARFIDVRADGLSHEILLRAFGTFGSKLLNTRSKTWQSLPESDRIDEPIELIQMHPLLMKRPLIEHDGELFLGWTNDVQAALERAT